MQDVDSPSGSRGDPSHITTRAAIACVLFVVVGAASGCKPSDEPPRQDKRESAESAGPVTLDRRGRPLPPTASDFDTPPPRIPTLTDPTPDPSGPSDGDVIAEDVTEAPQSEVDALLKPVSRDMEDKARASNTVGLKRHRKQDLRGAVSSYQEALQAWPGHILARYNLACALSLLGDSDAAIVELQRLYDMNEAGADAEESLAKARIDADLTSLHKDPRFRKITLSTEIVVTFARGDATAEADARRAHSALSNAHWPAKLAGEDALDSAAGPVVEALESDMVAAKAVTEIGRLAGMTRVVLVPRMAGASIRIVYPGAAAPAPEDVASIDDPVPSPTPVDNDPDGTSVDSWFGPRLTATHDGKTHQLQLKATGFFEWRITDASGRLEVRLGRYRATNAAIAFTFRRTVTTPTEGDDQPDIAVDEDLTVEHAVAASSSALSLDGLSFHR